MPFGRPAQRLAKPALLVLRTLNRIATRGHLHYGPWRMPCAIGRSGIKAAKREGDGATPRGRFPLRRVLVRSDAAGRVITALACRAIGKSDGWCDAPGDRNYNRPVRLPYHASSEHLWRQDRLYDVVVVLGYNDRPRLRNRGSAIFMHLARDDFQPTEGCVALRAKDIRRLLARIPRRTEIVIGI